MPIPADDHQVLRRAEHNALRPDLHRCRIFAALQLDLIAHRTERAARAIHRIQPVIAIREDVKRLIFDRSMQVVARCVVVIRIPAQRLTTLDRIFEALLTALEVDDVDLCVDRRIWTRHIQQPRRRQLGIRKLSFDLGVFLQAQRCAAHIKHVHERLRLSVHREHHRVAGDHRVDHAAVHAHRFVGDRRPIFIAGHVDPGLHHAIHDADIAHALALRRRVGQHDDPIGVLHDVANASFHLRRLGPQRLTVSQLVGHQTVIEAHVDAVRFVHRAIEPDVTRYHAALRWKRCRPAHRAGSRIQRPQPHQRVHDDGVRSCL